MRPKLHLIIYFTLLLPVVSHADRWDLSNSEFSVGVAELAWTVDEKFRGTKLLLDGKYVIQPDAGDEGSDSNKKTFKHTIGAHIQAGDENPAVEFAMVNYLYGAKQRDHVQIKGKFKPARDQLTWGEVILSKDDSLGVDYNNELTFGKIGRTWAYPAENGFVYGVSLHGSLGWAWASSQDPNYTDVSNPTFGVWQNAYIEFNQYGTLYGELMAVSGFTFGEPKYMTSRKGLAHIGYRFNMGENVILEAFLEKRAFLFAAFEIRDLYTKSKRLGINLGYKF